MTQFLSSSPPAFGRPTLDETFVIVARRVSTASVAKKLLFYGAEEPVL